MRSLVLVAAGGLAREALTVVDAAGRHDCVVAVDDDPRRWGRDLAGRRLGDPTGAMVIGGIDQLADLTTSEVVVCAGRGSTRRTLVGRLARLGVTADRYARLLHPGVPVPASCTVGPGSVVLAHVSLTSDVQVGAHVVLMPQVTLTHDDVVDDYATLCAGVSLGGGVHVGSAAYVGMNASVHPGRTVGPGATVGMGAVVLEDVPAGETWVGVPARPVRAIAGARR